MLLYKLLNVYFVYCPFLIQVTSVTERLLAIVVHRIHVGRRGLPRPTGRSGETVTLLIATIPPKIQLADDNSHIGISTINKMKYIDRNFFFTYCKHSSNDMLNTRVRYERPLGFKYHSRLFTR